MIKFLKENAALGLVLAMVGVSAGGIVGAMAFALYHLTIK